MTARKTELGLHSRSYSIVASVMFLLVFSIAWPTADGVAAVDEPGSAPWGAGARGMFRLPRGMDAFRVPDVMERNREHPTSRHMVSGRPESAGPFGQSFQIGGGPDPAPDEQNEPAIAFDGTNYLVAWTDRRNGSNDLYCARVTQGGEVLDAQGIVISAAHNGQGTAAVAFDGTNFLVVWDDWLSSMNPNINGARVSPDGIVLDTTAIIHISAAIDGQINPAIAFDGANYLVVWEDWRSGTRTPDIYGARVTPAGTVLDPDGTVISAAVNNQEYPAVAFDGTNYMVVWQDGRSSGWDIYGSRVSPSGAVLDTSGIRVSAAVDSQEHAAIAFDGTDYLIAWEDSRATWGRDIYGARVTPAGAVLDTSGIAISTRLDYENCPAIGFDGANYLVVWTDVSCGGARVSPAGTVLDPGGIAISVTACEFERPALAFGGVDYLVAWTDYGRGSGNPQYPNYETDVCGTRVDTHGSVLDVHATVVSTEPAYQSCPEGSFDGTNYLIVWHDSHNDIHGMRVGTEGTSPDTNDIAIAAGAGDELFPAIEFDGTNYLVVWTGFGSDSWDICGARVTPAGVVLDVSGIAISTGASVAAFPAIAFDGTNYLVVWIDWGADSVRVYGARVSPDGVVLDAGGIAIWTYGDTPYSYEYSYFPAVTFDGTNYLVVWTGFGSDSWDIYGARVTPAGVVLDVSGIAISTGASDELFPAIAFDGTNYLVVWTDWGADSVRVYGARVRPDGVVLDAGGIAISTGVDFKNSPAIAFDGINYLVAWEDWRSWTPTPDIYGARVTRAGIVIDPDGLPISMSVSAQPFPTVAHGADYDVLVAYSCYTESPYESDRIWGNLWTDPTSLTFVSASAASLKGNVALSWQMAVEVPASSFRIERSETREGGYAGLDLVVVKNSRYSFSCVDHTVEVGRIYWYKVVLLSPSGAESYGPIEARVDAAPLSYRAHQSFPNPFNPLCTIRYDMPVAGRVNLSVFGLDGSLVRTLADAWREPGVYSELWDGRADDGTALPSGVYFYRLESGDFVATRKMVLLR